MVFLYLVRVLVNLKAIAGFSLRAKFFRISSQSVDFMMLANLSHMVNALMLAVSAACCAV